MLWLVTSHVRPCHRIPRQRPRVLTAIRFSAQARSVDSPYQRGETDAELKGVVVDFGRSCLPGWTSRRAETSVHANARCSPQCFKKCRQGSHCGSTKILSGRKDLLRQPHGTTPWSTVRVVSPERLLMVTGTCLARADSTCAKHVQNVNIRLRFYR